MTNSTGKKRTPPKESFHSTTDENYGQVFTPASIAQKMWALAQNSGKFLEPSCGPGIFLAGASRPYVALEKDPTVASPKAQIQDFFTYSLKNKFTTIIGNPPYVRFQEIAPDTKNLLPKGAFDQRANLYLFFIKKCCAHLSPGGELIFITPRDFMKLTSAAPLNREMAATGGFTYFEDLGDGVVFKNVSPNVCIWRWEKGARTSLLQEVSGQLVYGARSVKKSLGDYFDIKVGAVSGADKLFQHDTRGNCAFVYSATRQTGQLRRMFYNVKDSYLEQYKPQLLRRKIKKFNEKNWWHWGRNYHESRKPRIYVNCKTRQANPFFINSATAYDGAVLALIPKTLEVEQNLAAWVNKLNSAPWKDLGFVCGGRYVFTQRALATIRW